MADICCITNDIGLLGCEDAGASGISEAWIANYADITAIAVGPFGQVTGITLCPTKCFFTLQTLREGAGATEAYASRRGSMSSTTTFLAEFQAETPEQMYRVRQSFGGQFVIIYKDKNGNFKLVGKVSPLEHADGTYTSGKGVDDDRGWTINLVTNEGSKNGGIRAFQTIGNPGDTQAVLNAATEQYIQTIVCTAAGAPCGCPE